MAHADSAVWTANANDALHLSLVRAAEDTAPDEPPAAFHPAFTYPIFGADEKIYGYQDLRIDLKFASGSLRQFLAVAHGAALPAKSADDVEGTLYKFIPADYVKSEREFLQRVEEDAAAFRPPGEKIAAYTRGGGGGKGKRRADAPPPADDADDAVEFEVFHATLATPGFRDFHRRMQLFVLLYIEAGSYIQEDDDRWEFVVLFERRRRKDAARSAVYHFVGYASLYPFWCWPDKVRLRLSQFIVLPPYQRRGHGSALYSALYTHVVLARADVLELTVEDPAEAFEDLRDASDLRMLLARPAFAAPPADPEAQRARLKLAKRQFQRLVEMLVLRALPPRDAAAARAFRLQVKERLYRFNYDALVQLDKAERLEKLEATFQSVREGYLQILERVQ